jgi:Uncharacterised nucleotidyltransferase
MDAAGAERVKVLMREDIDWRYVVRTAFVHGVTPLLYWHLHQICPAAVPEAILHRLRRRFRANAHRNLFLTSELFRILNVLMTYDIPAIPLKGPLLAISVYGNLALRQFRDLDVLVHKRDVLQAGDALMSLGYRPTVERPDGQEAGYVCVRDDGKVRIDLQWRITGEALAFPLDINHLRLRLQPLPFAGGRALNLPLEDLLVILCVHGCKHRWKRLNWISDVAEVICAHPQLDWGRVMAHARRLGTERMLMVGLYLARDLLGANLPAQVSHTAQRDPTVRALAAELRAQLFCESDIEPGASERVALYLRMRERFRDRARYRVYCFRRYLRIAVTPTQSDRARLPLPALLSPLYNLLRLLRLTRMYALHPRKFKEVLHEWFESMD